MRTVILAACWTVAAALPVTAQNAGVAADERPGARPDPASATRARTLTADQARDSIHRSLDWLRREQNPDGSWHTSTVEAVSELGFSPESFHSWKMAGVALAAMAFMVAEPVPENRLPAQKAMRWLGECRMPRRGSDWDIDNNWATLYCFQAFVEAAGHSAFQEGDWPELIHRRGQEFYDLLAANQDPLGGWGYYEGPVVSRRPTWSTSFSTACVIPALVKAKARGFRVDDGVLARAVEYVARCRVPGGAYEYDLNPIPRLRGGEHINRVKGSLGRIQVCNWALRRAGHQVVTDEVIRRGLEDFFRDHVFLDVARWKPIPHEAYYANAGYFYLFAHCYAGLVINELPAREREAYHARLRRHLTKVQWEDGSSVDYPGSMYLWVAGTAFSVIALQAGVP